MLRKSPALNANVERQKNGNDELCSLFVVRGTCWHC